MQPLLAILRDLPLYANIAIAMVALLLVAVFFHTVKDSFRTLEGELRPMGVLFGVIAVVFTIPAYLLGAALVISGVMLLGRTYGLPSLGYIAVAFVVVVLVAGIANAGRKG